MSKASDVPRAGPLALVSMTVLLQLASAWVLGHAAVHGKDLIAAALALGLAFAFNLLRFGIWGYTHRHFPLSQTYPMTALFFPCVLLLSYFNGQPVSALQIGGTALITFGALAMTPSKTGRRAS